MFVIPSYFTAVDRYSPTLGVMGKATEAFNQIIGKTAIIAAAAFTGKQILDYETELQNLKALTGVSGAEFVKFKSTIEDVANATRKSSVETAQAFTTIANAMPELLQSADGLGTVTTASILLAKAARMELTPAAEALTKILGQFGKGAETAASLVDMMAAGSKYGSAEISDLAETMTEFGAQARLSGISIKESIGITELVSKFRKGAEAGTQLKNVLTEMNKGMVQDPAAIADMKRLGVNIALVADKTKPISERFTELSKVMGDSNALFHIFGKENSAMAFTVLQNAGRLTELTNNIGESGNASRMAADNTSTLANRLIELKNVFITNITTSTGAALALGSLSTIVVFITNHMDGLITIASLLIGRLVVLKAITWGTVAAQWGLNFAMGIGAVVTGNLSKLFVINAAMSKGAAVGIWLMEAAQWALNIAMYANPIGLIIAGIVALGALFVLSSGRIKGWGDLWANVIGLITSEIDVFVLGAKLSFEILGFAFHKVANSIVSVWLWAQNKIGLISDKRYESEISKMSEMQDKRIANMKTTAADGFRASERLIAYGIKLPNSLSIKTDAEMDAESSAKESADSVASQQGQPGTDSLQKIHIELSTAPGTDAKIKTNATNNQVMLTKTGGAF